jgi:EmrB/QacA subfamily drug resistance transporter
MTSDQSSKRWAILLVVLIGSFMTTLDINIVNVALPNMASKLSCDIASIQWVVTSYLLVISSLVLVFGRISDIKGKKLIYQNGFLIFSIGSFLCSISSDIRFLIFSRIIQAIGAAMMMSCNFGIITMTFPENENGKAVGLLGADVAIGAMVGPSLGGFLVGMFNWQSIFIINIPIGITAYILGTRVLSKDENLNLHENFDIKGSILFTAAIISLFYALLNGEKSGWLSSSILICAAVSIISFIIFYNTEMNAACPMLDFKLFKNKTFSSGIFCAYISYTVIYFTNIINPFYLQHILNLTPQKAGLIIMVYPAVSAVAAPLGGLITDKIGYKLPTLIGLTFTCIGIFSMSFLNIYSSNLDIISRMSILGMGYGLFQSPNTTGIMISVPKNKLGIAGSLNSFIRNLGMTCGISFSVVLLYSSMSLKLGHYVNNAARTAPDIFVSSMNFVYVIGTFIALIGVTAAGLRFFQKKLPK